MSEQITPTAVEVAEQRELRRILYSLYTLFPASVMLLGIAAQSPETLLIGSGAETIGLLCVGLNEWLRKQDHHS